MTKEEAKMVIDGLRKNNPLLDKALSILSAEVVKPMIKRKCKNPKFQVIACCQGQPFHYQYSTLMGALFGYAKTYLHYNRYNTMNFTLKQI